MITAQKLEKKGYNITYNMGYKNGEQCIVSITATNGIYKTTANNITSLFKKLN